VSDFGLSVYHIARKEFLQHLRTKRLFIMLGLMVTFLVLLTLVFGQKFVQYTPPGVSKENYVLTIYFAGALVGGLAFTQLLGIVLTADAVCSEWSNRTIFLLLSKPVSRTAFVVGKYVGNVFTVAVTLVSLFVLDYLVMNLVYSGDPSPAEWLGFFGMLGIVVLGAAAYSALSLFVSTLTKSIATSYLITIGSWLIVLPVVGAIGIFSNIGSSNFDINSGAIQGWLYLNPAADMQAGAQLLVPDARAFARLNDALHSNPFALAPNTPWFAFVMLAVYAVVFLGAALLVVRRRNFE